MRQEFRGLLERYDRALEFVANSGVRVHPGSRLRSYRNALAYFTEQDPPIAPTRELERLAFALREIAEVIHIVEGLSHPPTQAEIDRLAAISAGAWHPDDEAHYSGVRDLQYELWLLSEFRTRGVPANLAEPDLCIFWRDRTYPVAAKRPRSKRSLDGCVRDALHQLDHQELSRSLLNLVERDGRASYPQFTAGRGIPT